MTFILCLLFRQRENSLRLITPSARPIRTEWCCNREKAYQTKHKALRLSQRNLRGDRSCCPPGSLGRSGAPGHPLGVRVILIMSSSGQEPGKAGVRNTALNASPRGIGLGASWKWCEPLILKGCVCPELLHAGGGPDSCCSQGAPGPARGTRIPIGFYIPGFLNQEHNLASLCECGEKGLFPPISNAPELQINIKKLISKEAE